MFYAPVYCKIFNSMSQDVKASDATVKAMFCLECAVYLVSDLFLLRVTSPNRPASLQLHHIKI